MGSDRRRKRDTEYQMRYWILHLEACWRVTGSRQQNLDAEQISAVTTHDLKHFEKHLLTQRLAQNLDAEQVSAVTTHGLKHLEKAAGTEKSTY